jgi:4-aminobutyrate aminotransferase-like enzyme
MDEAFFTRARAIGDRIAAAMRALQAQYGAIEDVRGLGAMMAMELSSGAPHLVEAARERGLVLLLAGERDVVRVLVPLVIGDEELNEGLALLAASAEAALR